VKYAGQGRRRNADSQSRMVARITCGNQKRQKSDGEEPRSDYDDPHPRPPCILFWSSNEHSLRSSSEVASARHCSLSVGPRSDVLPVAQPVKAAPALMTHNAAIFALHFILFSISSCSPFSEPYSHPKQLAVSTPRNGGRDTLPYAARSRNESRTSLKTGTFSCSTMITPSQDFGFVSSINTSIHVSESRTRPVPKTSKPKHPVESNAE
jgi:hypothetical protein